MYQPNSHPLPLPLPASHPPSLTPSLPPSLSLSFSFSMHQKCIYVAMLDLSVHPSTHVIQPAIRRNRSIYQSFYLPLYVSI